MPTETTWLAWVRPAAGPGPSGMDPARRGSAGEES